MRHFAGPTFWECYEKLPAQLQKRTDKNFIILKENPQHPSLHIKKTGRYWSVRVGMRCRALAVEVEDGLLWFWIGTHAEYKKLLK